MSKLTRVVDFQISGWCGLPVDEGRPINVALFATYYPVRLWLKERQVKGPFRKIVVSLDDGATTRVPAQVTNSLGVCQVFEGVPLSVLRERAGDHRWVLGVVTHALSRIAETLGWRSPELEGFLAEMAERPMPQVHFFERLRRVDRRCGTTCVPFLSASPAEALVGVRCTSTGGEQRDVTVFSRSPPLYVEMHFPFVKSAIRDGQFVLLDRGGDILASAPILEEPVARATRH